MRALFVLAAVLALAFAKSVELSFDAKANLTDAEAKFAFRYLDTDVKTLLDNLRVIGFKSVSVKADADDSLKAQADAMVGIGGLPSLVNFPFAVFAYGTGKAAVDFKWKEMDFLHPDFSLSLKGGLVAMVALGMQEVDEDNEEVGTFIPFTSPVYIPVISPGCNPEELSDEDGIISGLSCRFKPSEGDGVGVTVTFVTSKIAGVMEYGQTPVSPRSFDMIIEVDDFEYIDKKHKKKDHVRMKFAMFTLSGEGEVTEDAFLSHGDKEDLYVALCHHALVDGERVEVGLSIKSDAVTGLDSDSVIMKLLKDAFEGFGGTWDARIAYVDFPTGETDFVYDPAMGAGEVIYKAGASTVALSFLVALICAFVYLF